MGKRARKSRVAKRRKPYDGDPVMVTTLPRWGTKAQGKLNERERAYKNRIHDLEQQLNRCAEELTMIAAQRDAARGVLEATLPSRYVESLRKICMLPIAESVALGIDDALLRLCVWLFEIDKREEPSS